MREEKKREAQERKEREGREQCWWERMGPVASGRRRRRTESPRKDGSGMRGRNGRRKEKEGEKREEGRIEEVKRRKEGMVEEKRRKLMQDGSDMAFCGGSATSIDGYGTAGEAGGVPGPAP